MALSEGSVLAVIVGAAGGLARYFHEIMVVGRKFIWYELPMVIFVGSFMGYMGGALAMAYDLSSGWVTVAAGALAASGTYGFEVILNITRKLRQK